MSAPAPAAATAASGVFSPQILTNGRETSLIEVSYEMNAHQSHDKGRAIT
jgi:hypothetical protein